MRTIQEIIREMDPEKIAKSYFFEYPIKVGGFDKVPEDINVGELYRRAIDHMVGFINLLSDMEPNPRDNRRCILFLTKVAVDDTGRNGLYTVYADDVLEAESFNYEDLPYYSIHLTPQDEAISYLVSDNKYTQDHLHSLVILFLHELTFFGYDKSDVEKVKEKLKKSADSIDRGETIPADELFEKFRREYGLPRQEIYPREHELRFKMLEARINYAQYCLEVELERIKDSLMREG